MATVVQQRRPAANATRAQARKVKKSKTPVRAGVLDQPVTGWGFYDSRMPLGDISWLHTSCFTSSYVSSIKIYENLY